MHRSTFIDSRQAAWMHRGMKREDAHRIAELEAGDMGDLLEDMPTTSPDTVQDRIDELFPGQPRWVCGCGRKVIGGYCWSCGYSYRQHQDRHLEDVPPVSIEAESTDLDPLTITTADPSLSFSGKRSNQ